MSNSREESPDWLRAFEAPTRSVLTLSSGSEAASPHGSPLTDGRTSDKDSSPGETSQFPEKDEDDDKPISSITKEPSSKKLLKTKSPKKRQKGEQTPAKKRKMENGSAGGGKSSKLQKPETHAEPNAPTRSVLTLSSGSEASLHGSPLTDDRTNDKEPSPGETSQFPEKDEDDDKPIGSLTKESSLKNPLKSKSPNKQPQGEQTPAKKRKTENAKRSGSTGGGKSAKLQKLGTHAEPNAPISSVWALSSDSESPSNSPIREAPKGKSPKKGIKVEDLVATKKKSPNPNIIKKVDDAGNDGNVDAAEEEIAEKNIEPRFSSSRLPLVLSEKVSRTKALVECDGESIDLSGDVGAVGRVVISDNPSGNHDMFFDLKGTIYKTAIVPSRTFCVVSFGQSEAKVEAIMNDFIQLTPQSNVYEAETMVEGTLEGYSFDSDDDADKVPKTAPNQTDQNEDGGEQSNIKPKSKKAETASEVVRKRGKAAVGKPPKKPKKKTQAPKKSKTKK